MTDCECKQAILKILNDVRLNALRADRKSTAEHAAAVAGHSEWHKARPDDRPTMLFGQCPYNVNRAEKMMVLSRAGHKRMQEICQFAIDLFIK
jgi:hypothetical protein